MSIMSGNIELEQITQMFRILGAPAYPPTGSRNDWPGLRKMSKHADKLITAAIMTAPETQTRANNLRTKLRSDFSDAAFGLLSHPPEV
mmetsp:Transcript_25839/g.31338  ORF Transcript_25839/g.31338 Transcript_25839/m.31338 type:complete len:88 (+) Transcript_25839:316-579(+)